MQYATRHVIFVYILQSRECEGFSFINLVTFFTQSNMISGMFFFSFGVSFNFQKYKCIYVFVILNVISRYFR
jgi:hypothetical protein